MKRIRRTTSGVTRRDFLRTTAIGSSAVVLSDLANQDLIAQSRPPQRWDREADVVVIGSGATGMPAAIAARQKGATVIIVEMNYDVGGHAIICTGNVALGGGTSAQKAAKITDSPDLLYSDLTDWSVVESNGYPCYRYNDKEIMRAFADESAPTYDFLVAAGVKFAERPPDNSGAGNTGNSAPREMHTLQGDYPLIQTGQPGDPKATGAFAGASGIGLIRPLEATARKLGVEIMLKTRMTAIIREQPFAGRVIGITATAEGGKTLRIRAKKGVIIGTGGCSSNVNFRRIWDPRLTEEYCGVAGEPYTPQDASGELAGMAIGASVWGGFNQTAEIGAHIVMPGYLGCQYGYPSMFPSWAPTSPIFNLVRATGFRMGDRQNMILVNKAGNRFFDEMAQSQYTQNNYNRVPNYVPHSWRNATKLTYEPRNFLNAALAGVPGEPMNGGGPIWAIFDAEAAKRERLTLTAPTVDEAQGFFYSAATLDELANKLGTNKYAGGKPAAGLAKTIARYNLFVDAGVDGDFGRPNPKYKIQTGPFYAAWSTPILHDARVGLRINGKSEVVDLQGQVIPGLYCGGESAGGFTMHGVARCLQQGRTAGLNAAAQPGTPGKS
jgi:hypothetical protein